MTRRKHAVAEATYALTLSQQQSRADAGGAGGASSGLAKEKIGRANMLSGDVSLHSANTGTALCNEKSGQILRPAGAGVDFSPKIRYTDSNQKAQSVSHSLSKKDTPAPFELDAALKCDGELALVDRELARGAFVRGEVREYRAWCYGQNLVRSECPSALIPKSDFYDYLYRLGIVHTNRNFDAILKAGNGLYWKLRTVNDTTAIQLRGWSNLARRMVKLEDAKKPYIVPKEAPCQQPIAMRTFDTNQPGTNRVLLDLRGSIADARATLYKAWMMGRADNKMQRAQISRRVLQALWHVPRKTLLAMEKRAQFHPENVYDEHHDPDAPLVPSYAFLCQSKDGSQFASWRGSNWFNYQPVNKHPHGGQRRKVRKIVEATQQPNPASLANGGGKRAKRIGRLHLVSIIGRNGFTSAHKRLERHLRKHQDMHIQHYALLGFRYGVHIEELSTGGQYRALNQWRDQVAEGTAEFKALASQYRRKWTERWLQS